MENYITQLNRLSHEYGDGLAQTIQSAAYAVSMMLGERITLQFHDDFRVSAAFRDGFFVISAGDSDNLDAHPLVQYCQSEQERELMKLLIDGIAQTLWLVTPDLWKKMVHYANNAREIH